DRETVTLSTSPQFLALIERSRSRQATEGGISSDEMRRRLKVRPFAGAARRRHRTHHTGRIDRRGIGRYERRKGATDVSVHRARPTAWWRRKARLRAHEGI